MKLETLLGNLLFQCFHDLVWLSILTVGKIELFGLIPLTLVSFGIEAVTLPANLVVNLGEILLTRAISAFPIPNFALLSIKQLDKRQ